MQHLYFLVSVKFVWKCFDLQMYWMLGIQGTEVGVWVKFRRACGFNTLIRPQLIDHIDLYMQGHDPDVNRNNPTGGSCT